MLSAKRFFFLLQFLITLSILMLPLLILEDGINYLSNLNLLKNYAIFCLLFLTAQAINRYLLIPKLYIPGKIKSYIIAIFTISALIVFLRPFDKLMHASRPEPPHFTINKNASATAQKNSLTNLNKPRRAPRIDVLSLFLLIIIITSDLALETNKRLNQTIKRALSAEAEKSKAELSFLKAQVNPHFLFNTLNNIYTLAIIKDENTAPSIMKLSNMMRYITDEASNEFVDLNDEITCISDFISLHELRLGKKTELIYELKGNFETNSKIAPLILMAFVENVFKYGLSNHNQNKLIIKLTLVDNILNLFCQNSIYPDKKKTERSGIGLKNTVKRLQYIYPDKHILEIDNTNSLFTVKLTIHL